MKLIVTERAFVGGVDRAFPSASSKVPLAGPSPSGSRRTACHRDAFATAHEWVQRLTAANRAGDLELELERLGRTPLVID